MKVKIKEQNTFIPDPAVHLKSPLTVMRTQAEAGQPPRIHLLQQSCQPAARWSPVRHRGLAGPPQAPTGLPQAPTGPPQAPTGPRGKRPYYRQFTCTATSQSLELHWNKPGYTSVYLLKCAWRNDVKSEFVCYKSGGAAARGDPYVHCVTMTTTARRRRRADFTDRNTFS